MFGAFSAYSADSSCIRRLNTPRLLKTGSAEYAVSYSASSLIRLILRLFGQKCRHYHTKIHFQLSLFGQKPRLFQIDFFFPLNTPFSEALGTDGRMDERRTDGRTTDGRTKKVPTKKFRKNLDEKIPKKFVIVRVNWGQGTGARHGRCGGKARVTEIHGRQSPPDPPCGARHE